MKRWKKRCTKGKNILICVEVGRKKGIREGKIKKMGKTLKKGGVIGDLSKKEGEIK